MPPFNISKLEMNPTKWHLKFNEIWYIKDLGISQPSTANIQVSVTIICHLDDCRSFRSGLPASPLTLYGLFSNDS